MNQTTMSTQANAIKRVRNAIIALQQGKGVLVTDNEDRENEGDLIFHSSLSTEQMALLIRECSGIVCLCITEKKRKQLNIPMMVQKNKSHFQTAFTVSIEASEGVTTGVSAKDRLRTIQSATSKNADPTNIHSPGHVFPLVAKEGGVLERQGHTEATVDLMKLANLEPHGVLCELTNANGSMAKKEEIESFGKLHDFPVLSVEDIITYRRQEES